MNISAFVEKHVFVNQTLLVSDLLETFEDMRDEISNSTDTDEEGNTVDKEIHEWWIVSDWLLSQLESRSEPILKDRYGVWWGRCCTGQAIANDTVIQEIFVKYCITDHQ
jgi:hypothetical protein